MVARGQWTFLAVWWVMAGCSSQAQRTTDSVAPPTTSTDRAEHDAPATSTPEPDREFDRADSSPDVADIVLQVGNYELATNIDGFVSGPSLIVYADGRFAATVTTTRPEWTERYVCGELMGDELRGLLADSRALPSNPLDTGRMADDLEPSLLVAGDRRWELEDPTVEPFGGFVERLDQLVVTRATDCSPDRWVIVDEPYGERCTITTEPSEYAYLDAPLYPHLSDLDGAVGCDEITGRGSH